MKKGVDWKWGPPEQEASDKLKELIITALVMAFPDDSQMYHVGADASDMATRVTISQQSLEDGKWHLIAFFSKSLSPVKWNYEIHDKEVLAIIHALEGWQHFLEGAQHKFEIWKDHKNLEYFQTSKKLNRCQAKCLSTCPASTSHSITDVANPWEKQTHCPRGQTTPQVPETMAT